MTETKIEIWSPLIQESGTDWLEYNDESKEKVTRHLAQLLQSESLTALAGCGCSCQLDKNGKPAGGPGMGDLWTLADEPTKTEIIKITNYDGEKNIENLLSHCEASLAFISAKKDREKVDGFLEKMRESIRKRCTDFLAEKSSFNITAHIDFLRRVARRPANKNRFMLYTTNYDLCFEKSASQAQFVIIDGFSFTSPRQYDPAYYGYDIVRKLDYSKQTNVPIEALFYLYKLHGSVNWDETDTGIVQNDSPKHPCMIYPASSKYQSSYRQPYLEMVSRYLQAIRQPSNTLLVLGFGFADDHLVAPIQSALRSNNEFRMVIVDPNIKESLIAGKGNYAEIKQWQGNNDPRLTFINSTFSQFVNLVPEIYKPTAGENLVESVKKIAKSTGNGS